MKVFVEPPFNMSRAMFRVSHALAKYAPLGVQVTKDPVEADLVVMHVIGYQDSIDAANLLTKRGQQYGVIQYCLRSTARPHTMYWAPFWAEAQIVWSYYDLPRLTASDNFNLDEEPNWYISPLGADAEAFNLEGGRSDAYTILTSGYVAETEGVREAAEAVHRVGGQQFHLGPNLNLNGTRVHYQLGISDEDLARAYRSSKFVAGLRRGEGFELPAAEGLLCGARPIMFDQPHYRRWFDGFAEFIPEGTHEEVTDSLEKLFRTGPRPVSEAEILAARDYFDWETIVTGFWERALA